MDPGGYDAYRVERRFSPIERSDWESSKAEVRDLTHPNRFNLRSGLTDEEIERVRGGGWDLPTLQKVVDQFVIHFDVCGVSRQCFKVKHDLICRAHTRGSKSQGQTPFSHNSAGDDEGPSEQPGPLSS